jgi:hypothetical protein
MPRFARIVAAVALVAALYCRAQANPAAQIANLDPARMFNPVSESLLADLFNPPKNLSPLAVALFGAPASAAVATIASPVAGSASDSHTVASVNLHAYTAPLELPAQPLEQPSITPAAPVAAAHVAAPRVAAVAAPPVVRFGSYTPYIPAVQHVSEDVRVPVRIGGVHFAGTVSGSQAQTVHADAVRAMQLCGTTDEAAACPYLHDERSQSLAAGTDFDVRAGNTRVNLQLSGSVGRVSTRDAAMYQYAPLDPDTQLNAATPGSPGDTALLYYPGLTDMVSHGVNARLAVPISPVISVGLQYDRAHYQGSYGALLSPGVDATKNTYLGNLTYQLPHSSSLITLSARQYRYQDTFAPNFNLTETCADLSFTVKF